MSETNEKRVNSYNKDEMDAIENYPHNNSKTGVLMYEHKLVVDPETGMTIKQIRYPKGCMIPLHTHHCAHSIYVLKGTLVTSHGTFGPGEFVWHDEGVEMTHGASDEEDVDILFITNKALDMNYL